MRFMHRRAVKIEFEPLFVEEAVFFSVKELRDGGDPGLAQQFYGERDRLYETAAPAEREAGFQDLNGRWFEKLGLAGIFRDLIAEFHVFSAPPIRFVVRRAFTRKDERGELFGDAFRKTLMIAVRISLLASRGERPALQAFLRHELTQLSDILDPGFKYSRDPVLGGAGEIENEAIRERFALLWSLYTAFRLKKKGLLPAGVSRERQERDLEMAFPFWSEEVRGRVLRELEAGRSWTQPELIALAAGRSVRNIAVFDRPGWFRCALCGFPGFRPAEKRYGSDQVLERIRSEHPDWKREMEICEQCYEIYQSRPAEEIS